MLYGQKIDVTTKYAINVLYSVWHVFSYLITVVMTAQKYSFSEMSAFMTSSVAGDSGSYSPKKEIFPGTG